MDAAAPAWPSDAMGAPPPLPLEATTCLFGCVALLAARALLRMGRPGVKGASPVNTGLQMRRILVVGLLVASSVRCLSLATLIAFDDRVPLVLFERLDQVQLEWLRDLVAFLPAIVFLSAFSVLVLFWAQLHYTTTIVPLPLLDCLFVCVNIACYLLVAAIAVCTFLLQAYNHLQTYMLCIIGFLNTIVGLSFMYYGFMVVSELAETARKKLPSKRLGLRVVLLSVICPLAFFIRGACYLAWGFSLGRPSWSANIVFFIVGEWLPSVAALVVINPLQRGVPKSPTDSLDDSTDSEAPLLVGDSLTPQRSLAGQSGLSWKQLYPQPDKT